MTNQKNEDNNLDKFIESLSEKQLKLFRKCMDY